MLTFHNQESAMKFSTNAQTGLEQVVFGALFKQREANYAEIMN